MVECRVEPLSYMLLNGLVELALEAWQETKFSIEHPHIPYGPDWEGMQAEESANNFRMVAMREGGKLIGYTSVLIGTDAHNALLRTGTIRDVYVSYEKRGYAAQLVRFTEKLLSSIGARRAIIGERVLGLRIDTKNAKFYQVMGFEAREIIHSKTLH